VRRTLLLILTTTVFASYSWSQEDEADEPSEAEQTETAPEVDEPIVDDEYYQDVDDEDFRPSEDIPADQSIPFPTDI
jgi:hypothetical protein